LLAAFIVGFVVNVPLGIAMVHWIGPIGVASATFITMTAISASALVYSSRLVGVSVWTLFPVGALARRFLAAAVPGVVMWVLYRRYPVDQFYELVIAGIVYLAMYALICAATRLVHKDDLKSLLGRTPA
jgi:hypothetical protein